MINDLPHVTELPGFEYGQKDILELLADMHYQAYTDGDGATTFAELAEELLHNNGMF